MAQEFDFVIVGAGSAGCVLANRLSADRRYTVLLIEGGGKDNWLWFHIPVGYLFAIGNPRADWCYKTEPERASTVGSSNYPRGKVLGGSSQINAMIYMRGQAADYDGWRQLGLERLGLGRRAADLPAHRGPLPRRERIPRRGRRMAGRGAARALGNPRRRHRGGGRSRHSALRRLQHRQQPRLRVFPGESEARPALERGTRLPPARSLKRPNLKVDLARHADNFLEGRRATGVEISGSTACETISARRKVSSPRAPSRRPRCSTAPASAAAHQLQSTASRKSTLPGVGENLQDHLQLRPMFKVPASKPSTRNTTRCSERAHGPEYA